MLIRLVNLCKSYDNGLAALKDINMDIDVGEFVFLTGQSGAGKSTLIRLLFREELPTSGQILIGGRSVARLSHMETVTLRRNSGIIFQDFRLMEQYNLFDNVALAQRALGIPINEIRKNVSEVLEKVGLSGREKDTVMHLSGGEQQRVAVARAIINKPLIVYADEPTGDLDPQTSGELMQLFMDVNKEGTTIVMATHDRDIVNSMQKRVVTLSGGRLVSDSVGGWRL